MKTPAPDRPHPWLGGLTPRRFMRDHWQRRPLHVPGALAAEPPPIDARGLIELAGREGVESRLVVRPAEAQGAWRVRHGPFSRRALPPLGRPGWTLLVQGVDLHLEAAHALLQPFRFTPDARLDDLMVSLATPGGGVGPHRDSYDVFLLQLQGCRRWRVGPPRGEPLRPGQPLKLLDGFEPTEEWRCQPGDLLYVPPGWGHDGVAEAGDLCLTASVGYRAPARGALAVELLQRLLEAQEPETDDPIYRDPGQAAVDQPGRVPERLQAWARDAARRLLGSARAFDEAVALALGEVLSEPKPGVWFDPVPASPLVRGRRPASPGPKGVRLDRRSRMLHDGRHLFINGEAFRVTGSDRRWLVRLADRRMLTAAERGRLGPEAATALAQWVEQGWAHDTPPTERASREQP